jgi:hypothetical protein
MVLRRIFGLKRDEILGGWRKLHNEELHDLYSSPYTCINRIMKSRRLRWTGYIVCVIGKRNAYRVLVGKPGGKRPLGRLKRRWGIILKLILEKRDGLVLIGFIATLCIP